MKLDQTLSSAFLALPLEHDAKEQFHRIYKNLLPYDEKELSLQSPETPHLTFYFWQTLMPIETEDVRKHAEAAALKTIPFSLQITGIDSFKSHGMESVLFLSVAFSEELARLKKYLPWPNEQPFHPHITIARIRHAGRFAVKRKQIYKELGSPSFAVTIDRLRLYAKQGTVTQFPLRDFPFVRRSAQ